jgi:hypothetical protein
MLLAIFALGAFAASVASAADEEPGILPLGAAFAEEVKVKVTNEGRVTKLFTKEGGIGKVIECKKVQINNGLLGKGELKHITLGTGLLWFRECSFNGLACLSINDKNEMDKEGEILVFVDIHLINVLKESTLEPGVGFLILELPLDEATKKPGPVKIECGIAKLEVKGFAKGLLLGTNALVGDTTTASVDFFKQGETCDTSDTLCKKLSEENPFLAKVVKVFENAEEETVEPVPIELSEMALVDD